MIKKDVTEKTIVMVGSSSGFGHREVAIELATCRIEVLGQQKLPMATAFEKE
ncbi:hypothetical protein [Nitrosomonas communis]|jgi:hypothetical protein|uniref:Uncharacterized protein n=1 Tax=Nitrosomonas communis TaxID=44574 RepID=A0A1I4S258_9PROT|nr:hypothetical protein [Nitrosomonas communis]SFM58588.1 hypothetical protein SAMN05421863_10375 [Nitrosomonas communis]